MKIEVGKTYETREGKLVRVICTDLKGDKYPIVGLFSKTDKETVHRWTINGYYLSPHEVEHPFDLICEHVPVTYRWYRVFEHKEVGMAWEKSFVNAPTDIGLIKLAFDPSGNLVIDKCEITGAQPNG